MKKLILAVLLLMLSTPVWAAPDADHDADRAAAAFSVVTPATDDYWILTDTSNSGRFAKVATSNVRAALGLGASDNPTFNSLNITGSNIASSNKQVTKAWTTGLSYTANVTSVIHGGRHYICTSNHTASAAGTGAGTNEPGVGDDWATVWTLGVLGDNTIYTQDTEPAGGTDGDIWVDTNGTSGQRLYTREESTWVAQAGGGGGISHATSDGSYYASRNGAWAAIDSVFLAPTGSGASLTVTATGFDGNLTSSDNTIQEIAQKFDDFTASGTGDMVLANAQTVTGKKTFENSDLAMLGSSTGATTFASANAGASNYTATFQAATGTVAYTADVPTAGSLSVDDLITLSGVATGAVNLGSFTGATIDDNLTVKAAMQDMETSFEAKLPAGADGEYGAWLTSNTVNPNTYSTGKIGYTFYNNVPQWCYNGTCTGFATNPMTTAGDMIKGGTAGAPTRMIPGTGIVTFLETPSGANLATALTTSLPTSKGGTGVANDTNNTITFTGNYSLGITLSGATAVTLPTSGTLTTNPMTTSGDMVKGGASGVPTRMIPATGVVSFLETSSSANLATALTDENTASGGICTNPMTTAGDLITGGASGAHTARIAAVATGSVLVSQGTSTAPAYSANPQVTTIELGAASDTTLARSGAGAMTLEGVAVPTISSSSTLTNKTLDVEGTGNAITTVEKIWFAAAGCNNATAATFFDLPTTNAPASACITGTNTQKAVLDYDAATDESGQVTLALPADFTGAIDVKYKWLAAATTGSVVWGVQTICVADAETDDPSFNTASTVTDAVKGTTLQTNDASITGVTATGCAAGELMHLRFFRDADNGADDMTGDARLIGAEVTLRRAQ
jgi:hypothetical protein